MGNAQKVKENEKVEEKKVEEKIITAYYSLILLKAIQDEYKPNEENKKDAVAYMRKVFKFFGVSIGEKGLEKNDEENIKTGLKEMIDKKLVDKVEEKNVEFLKEMVDSINISEMWNEVVNGDSLYTIEELHNKEKIKYAVDYLKLAGVLMVLGDKHVQAALKYESSEEVKHILDINNKLLNDEHLTAYGRYVPTLVRKLPLQLSLQFFPDMLNTALGNARVKGIPKEIPLPGEVVPFAEKLGWPIREEGSNVFIDSRELIGNIDHLRQFNFEFLTGGQYSMEEIIEALGITDQDVINALNNADSNTVTDILLKHIAKHSEEYVELLKNLKNKGYKGEIPGHAFTALLAFAEAAEALRKTVKETILNVNKNLLMSSFSFGYNTRTGNFEFKVFGQIAYTQFGESIGEGAERYGLLGIGGEINYKWGSGVAGLRYTLWNDFTSTDLSFAKRMTHQFNFGLEQMLSRYVFVGGIANISGGTFSWKGDAWVYVGYTGSWGSVRIGPTGGFTWMNLANIAEAQLGVSGELGNIITYGIDAFAYEVGGKVQTNLQVSKNVSILAGLSAGALLYAGDEYFKGSATIGLRWDNPFLPVEVTVSYQSIFR